MCTIAILSAPSLICALELFVYAEILSCTVTLGLVSLPQLLLSEQQQHIQLLTTQVTGLQNTLAQQASDQPLRQLKEEMSSLKGILLSRHQFPATPTRVGVANGGIPVWQRASDTGTPTKKPLEQQQQPNLNGDQGEENETVQQNENGTTVQDENETFHREQGLLDETSAS